jgi:hypothetical protein
MIYRFDEIKNNELENVKGGISIPEVILMSGEPDVGQTPRNICLGDPDVPTGPGGS